MKSNRGFRYRQLSKIGFRLGVGEAKRHLFKADTLFYSTRTLYQLDLTNIAKTTTNAINERQRDMINVSGFRLRWTVNNRSSPPLHINFAMVAPKTDSLLSTDFFRAAGSERASDFSNGLNDLQFATLPINTDKHNILWHHRTTLSPETVGAVYNSETNNFKTYSKYIKLKRQIRYDPARGSADSPVYFLYWADQFNTVSGTAAQTNSFQMSYHHITYFREV